MEDQALPYCLIPLTKGQVAKVSPSCYIEISQWKWHAWWSIKGKCFYAVRSTSKPKGTIYMHRQILGISGKHLYADHRNHDTLDNTDENLRIATPTQSARNVRRRHTNKSGFKGVTYCPRMRNKWKASITIDGENLILGYFETPEEAHAHYADATMREFGEFARVN